MRYYDSQWTNALADLKCAANDAGVSYEQTDTWAVRHDVVPGEIGSVFGRYDGAGAFRIIAAVGSPHALRELASLYPVEGTPELPPAPTMSTMPGDVVMVDGAPRVVTSAVRTTHHGRHGLSVAHVAPGDANDPTAAANAPVVRVTAPDVRTMPV